MREAGKKLSLWRAGLGILILAGVVYLSIFGFKWWKTGQTLAAYKPWFAAYVDVTSTPSYAFEQLGSTSTQDAVLAFIVSAQNNPCTPAWGGAFTLDQAGDILNLDRRIARLQQQNGKIAISFGGALNDELALKCTNEQELMLAYKAVIDRYSVNTVDLDLEKDGLSNSEAMVRRAAAWAKIQTEQRKNGKALAIWLTLPVTPQGLTTEGTDAVATMLRLGVDLSGVNIMTMDYGNSRSQGQSMLDASKSAINETHRQMVALYKRAGISLDSKTLWRKIGVTPMIGQNDVVEEVFTLADATGINDFAINRGIGRMSMWSANRDVPCGENYVDVRVVSDSCSGLKTEAFAFAHALANGFDGDLGQSAKILTASEVVSNIQPIDDPAKSPYQIWQELGAYPQGVKVVWHGNVYEAKWWTKGDMPDNPVLQAWETPWQLVGPVLPGEQPIPQLTLPKGTYMTWTGSVAYQGGERVLLDGIPFQAKWWNRGESPAAAAANPDDSPWVPLTQAEIVAVLKGTN